MKKIMFALAAVAMATVASASTFSWGISSGTLDAEKFASGTAYLFYTTATSLSLPTVANKESGTYGVADVTSSGASVLYSASVTDGAVFESGINLTSVDSKTGVVRFYMAIISDDGKNVALTTATTTARIAAATTGAAASWISSKFDTYSVTSTSPTDPTPEPTSGLLLLVGGAMLALRRKQK